VLTLAVENKKCDYLSRHTGICWQPISDHSADGSF
jgi:hypothetical protein